MTILIERSSDTPIRPKDIDSDSTFLNVFGERDLEVSAYWIVRYCQARRSWSPFDYDKLVRFLSEHEPRQSAATNMLFGLGTMVLEGLIRIEKKKVTLTTAFVARCYGAAAVPGLPRKKRPYRPSVRVKTRYERLLDDDA